MKKTSKHKYWKCLVMSPGSEISLGMDVIISVLATCNIQYDTSIIRIIYNRLVSRGISHTSTSLYDSMILWLWDNGQRHVKNPTTYLETQIQRYLFLVIRHLFVDVLHYFLDFCFSFLSLYCMSLFSLFCVSWCFYSVYLGYLSL